MDGNGRWAQNRHLPRTVGHAKGAAGIRSLVERCAELGIQCLTLFAFSTENWQRPEEEVSTLMGLFVQYLQKEMKHLAAAGVRLKVIGDVSGFSFELQERIKMAEDATAGNTLIDLCVAANYGGRWDVLQAFRSWQAANPGVPAEHLTDAALERHLSTAGLPEVDLLIRTGGEQRISNFLLWQSAYSELYFTEVLWPDFGEEELMAALNWFNSRVRRYGMTDAQIAEPNSRVAR